MRDRVERLLEVHEAYIEWLLMLACTVVNIGITFLPRDSTRARYMLWPSVHLSVGLSVCPSVKVGVLSNRPNVGSSKQHHR